jgi:hypothetical protein
MEHDIYLWESSWGNGYMIIDYSSNKWSGWTTNSNFKSLTDITKTYNNKNSTTKKDHIEALTQNGGAIIDTFADIKEFINKYPELII